MELPTALVERWPSKYSRGATNYDHYQKIFPTMEAALKHTTREALLLYHEICLLDRQWRSQEQFDINNRKSPSYVFNKHLDPIIRSKQERLNILLKYSDFPSMVVAAYQEAQLLEKSKFWHEQANIDYPVLVRGIANGVICDHVQKSGKDFYFIESGYLGNYPSVNNDGGKKIYHRIVKNAMQHSIVYDVPDDRWRQLCEWNKNLDYRGWRSPGSKILLVAPSEKPCKYYNINREDWIKETIESIRAHSDREIIIREKSPRWSRSQSTIYNALAQDIWATVTYNSIAAVESVHFGIPAIALAPTAASPVCGDDLSTIEQPFKPNENFIYRWLSSLAYGQFSLIEMLSGQAWQTVLANSERQTLKYDR